VLWALRSVNIHVIQLPLLCGGAASKTDDIVRAGREVSAALSLGVIANIGCHFPIKAMFAVRTRTIKTGKKESSNLRCRLSASATVVLGAYKSVALWGIVKVILDI
jgi:hypothetical protein